MLVSGAINICDSYICAVSRVCAKRIARCLLQARCLCSGNVAIEAYFVGEKCYIGCRSCSVGRHIMPYLLNETFLGKSANFKTIPVLR